MNQLKAYSQLTGDVVDIGPESSDLETLTNLGEMMANSRESLIVFVDGPALQKWEPSDD